ncbi:MAG: ATP-grasp domain-containing protein [Verrucomicrobiota bacterium]
MPTLILSSSYTTESKILRKAAESLKWETFRFEGENIPSWYDQKNRQHAIYCTVPKAFNVASRLDSILLGCSSNWLPSIPDKFLKRRIQLVDLKHAIGVKERCFIKPALGKSFAAAVRTGESLVSQTSHLPPDLLVHASEVVEWEAEYRCFIKNNEVLTLSPYRRGKITFSSYASPLEGPRHELEAASEFAKSVLSSVPCPKGFVLDVGIIKGKGWAVVEPNECWGSGVYGCMPTKVLEVLLAATVQKRTATQEDMAWNYAESYFRACPHMKAPQS